MEDDTRKHSGSVVDSYQIDPSFQTDDELRQEMLDNTLMNAEIATVGIGMADQVSLELTESISMLDADGGFLVSVGRINILCGFVPSDDTPAGILTVAFMAEFIQDQINSDDVQSAAQKIVVLVRSNEEGTLGMWATEVIDSSDELVVGTMTERPEVSDEYAAFMAVVMEDIGNYGYYDLEYREEDWTVCVRNDKPRREKQEGF